ncbi:receptor like protein 27-like [Pyrus x bretschneideri]|uniref:receptor like protein 27-like n=1 Tax=Pyrus x bretschneideri TaxID=225117 RepID=UPI00202E5CF2|nr:receptor like protein 27-like [Pyrus x bretschneideri]
MTPLKTTSSGWVEIFSTFPDNFVNTSSLTSLKLPHCGLYGEFPIGVFHLPNSEVLYVHKDFKLTGYFLNFNRNDSFKKLSVGEASFSGPLPMSIGNLRSLTFSNLKNLKKLRLSSNQLSLQIKPNLNATLPKFQIMRLVSCNLTEFPEFSKNQDELYDLNSSNNRIHGQIPKWFWNTSRKTLKNLALSHNVLTGLESFDRNPPILTWKNLVFFAVRSNLLQGSLPIPPQSIITYDVANNDYNGDISPLFCSMNVQVLDLADNNLSGMLPQCLGNSSALEILNLSNNSFNGDIPQLCPNKNSLRMVDLSDNHLQGKVPRELPVLKALILLYNEFRGIIGKPSSNHEFPNLCIIYLSHNGFSGMLPSNYLENWNFVKFVNETNQTYFEVSSTNATNATYIYQYKITILAKGAELKYLKTPYLLRLIDLSSNRFEGEIPAGIIGKLRDLHLLNLSNNTLSGLIPSSLGNLTALESLDLSGNQLSGSIPNSYQGNSGLCGKPLSKKCKDSESSTSSPPSIFEEDEDPEIAFKFDWYMVLPRVFCGLIVGFVAGDAFADKKHEWFVETFSKRRRQLI